MDPHLLVDSILYLRPHFDLDVGKGLGDNMICKRHEQLHSNFRQFECEGCRKRFARMDALNRHLKSETGVEYARVVERGKGSGSGGGVLGDLDSGLSRWCRYFVWGDILINTFNLNFHPLHRFALHCLTQLRETRLFCFWFVTDL